MKKIIPEISYYSPANDWNETRPSSAIQVRYCFELPSFTKNYVVQDGPNKFTAQFQDNPCFIRTPGTIVQMWVKK